MARKKVKLAWIANDATRRSTLKKRRKGLLKKVGELSILCGVELCAVVYAPEEHQPVAWPSPAEAARMLAQFRSLPEIKRRRKMVNQEAFLHQRIAKQLEQLRRQQRENRETEMTALILEGLSGRPLHDISIEDASALSWMVETKLRSIYERLEELDRGLVVAPPAPEPPLALPPPPPPATLPPLPPASVEGGGLLQHRTPSWLIGEAISPWIMAAVETGHTYVDHGGITSWTDAMLQN